MIEVDRERCIGAGMCVLTAPEVFDQSDDDGRVLVRDEPMESHPAADIQQAVALCPSGALSLKEPS